jgi:hypothetical protein
MGNGKWEMEPISDTLIITKYNKCRAVIGPSYYICLFMLFLN